MPAQLGDGGIEIGLLRRQRVARASPTSARSASARRLTAPRASRWRVRRATSVSGPAERGVGGVEAEPVGERRGGAPCASAMAGRRCRRARRRFSTQGAGAGQRLAGGRGGALGLARGLSAVRSAPRRRRGRRRRPCGAPRRGRCPRRGGRLQRSRRGARGPAASASAASMRRRRSARRPPALSWRFRPALAVARDGGAALLRPRPGGGPPRRGCGRRASARGSPPPRARREGCLRRRGPRARRPPLRPPHGAAPLRRPRLQRDSAARRSGASRGRRGVRPRSRPRQRPRRLGRGPLGARAGLAGGRLLAPACDGLGPSARSWRAMRGLGCRLGELPASPSAPPGGCAARAEPRRRGRVCARRRQPSQRQRSPSRLTRR